MKTAMKLLLGLLLMVAVSGCCCFGDRGRDTCWTTAPTAPMVSTTTPHVTIE